MPDQYPLGMVKLFYYAHEEQSNLSLLGCRIYDKKHTKMSDCHF